MAACCSGPHITLIGVLAVACGAVLGVALRVLFNLAAAGIPVIANDGYALSNLVGSFVMGAARGSTVLQTRLPRSYLAATTGFCGSLTTFSTWLVTSIGSATVAQGVARLFVGLSLPFVSFLLGRDAISLLESLILEGFGGDENTTDPVPAAVNMGTEPTSTSEMSKAPASAPPALLVVLDAGIVGAFGVASSLMVVLVATLWEEQQFALAVVSCLAPIGSVVRYALVTECKRFDQGRFPLGTLLSNVLACVLAAALVRCSLHGDKWCSYVTVGICGSMSTVSSWVQDTVLLREAGRPWVAYAYCVLSVFVCSLIIMGPFIAEKTA